MAKKFSWGRAVGLGGLSGITGYLNDIIKEQQAEREFQKKIGERKKLQEAFPMPPDMKALRYSDVTAETQYGRPSQYRPTGALSEKQKADMVKDKITVIGSILSKAYESTGFMGQAMGMPTTNREGAIKYARWRGYEPEDDPEIMAAIDKVYPVIPESETGEGLLDEFGLPKRKPSIISRGGSKVGKTEIKATQQRLIEKSKTQESEYEKAKKMLIEKGYTEEEIDIMFKGK